MNNLLLENVDIENQLRPIQKFDGKTNARPLHQTNGTDISEATIFIGQHSYNDRASKIERINKYTFTDFLGEENAVEPDAIRYGMSTRVLKYQKR